MEHSHSSPNGSHISPSQRSPSNYAPAVTSPINSTTTHPRLNQQSRRLQLRNVGFRGPVLPARRISPIISASQQSSEPFSHLANNENSPTSSDKRTLYGEDLPPSPVSILQEIHNSKRRRRISRRSEVGQIFQDSTATDSIAGEGNSWYIETSNNGSPIASNMTPVNVKKLREVSLNGKASPASSSPLMRQGKGRNERSPDPRSTSSGAAKYIEHLEEQLCAVNARLELVMSPSGNKARSAKLRALTAESLSLRQEVCDWERLFAERVREEKRERLDIEIGLQTRLQALEDDLEIKDAKIRELECELESIRTRVREAEGLEAVNVDLERRIDVLTNLLVQSPTRLELSSATSSPSKVDRHKRTPRPRSMLPRVPFSPGGGRSSLSTVSESAFQHCRGFGSTSSISGSSEGVDAIVMHEEEIVSPVSNRGSRQLSSMDLDSGASSLFRSAASSSRPASIQSASSLGTASWGLPLPPDTELQAKSMSRQRRMRRFPSGTCSLKPLILPTATTVPSLPASAPIYPSSPTPSRNITDISLDPTTAFLSRHDFSSPTSTPTQPNRQHSASWAQEQALKSLEGRDKQPESAGSLSLSSEEQLRSLIRSPFEKRGPRRFRPRSLEEELALADLSVEEPCEDEFIPVDLDKSTELDMTSIGLDHLQSHTPLHKRLLRERRPSFISDTTPKPDPRPKFTPTSPPKAIPSSVLATRDAFGIVLRLMDLINRTRQAPLTLAQRLLHNAWMHSSARLSGTGWWLIGLVFGFPWAKCKGAADGGPVDGHSRNNDFDWHHYSSIASRRRTAEHYLGGHGGEYAGLAQATAHLRNARNLSAEGNPKPREEPQVFPCDTCIEPSSHRTLRLWWQFSLAIVLAVGVAIKHGPGVLLVDNSMLLLSPTLSAPQSPRSSSRQPREEDAGNTAITKHATIREDEGDRRSLSTAFTFVEPLGLGDFEEN